MLCIMKRYLNFSVLNRRTGLEFGQGCQANLQTQNCYAVSIDGGETFNTSVNRSLFKIIALVTLRRISQSR